MEGFGVLLDTQLVANGFCSGRSHPLMPDRVRSYAAQVDRLSINEKCQMAGILLVLWQEIFGAEILVEPRPERAVITRVRKKVDSIQ